jgi:hypothetical protein
MRSYQCYAIGADGHIQERKDFLADNDAQALEQARSLYPSHSTFGFELWSGAELIHQESARTAKAT